MEVVPIGYDSDTTRKKMLSSYYKNPTVCIKNQLVTAFGHTYENKYNVFKSFIYI